MKRKYEIVVGDPRQPFVYTLNDSRYTSGLIHGSGFSENRQRDLLRFVVNQHEGQLRKEGSPYWKHLLEVLAICCAHSTEPLIGEVAICHDLFEDTAIESTDFIKCLHHCGYSGYEAKRILYGVTALTKYSSDTVPRAIREKQYSDIVGYSDRIAQDVKLADIISNFRDTSCLSPDFLEVYRTEKLYQISRLKNCNSYLRDLANDLVKQAGAEDVSDLDTSSKVEVRITKAGEKEPLILVKGQDYELTNGELRLLGFEKTLGSGEYNLKITKL